MRRKRRWSRILLGMALLAALVVALGWRWVGRYVRDNAKQQLAALNGAPVEIESADLGLGGLDLRGVRFLEAGSDGPKWMSIEHARFEVPIWKILSEDLLARKIVVDDANIRLRFDRNGNLLNRFARLDSVQAPRLHLDARRLRVEVVQDGRPPLVADSVDLEIRGLGDRLRADGTVGQLLDAQWNFESEIDGRNLNTEVRLATSQLPFDTKELDRLPFVPAESLDNVHAQGVTSASVVVRYGAAGPFQYQIDLEPKSTVLEIPAMALHFRQAQGKLQFKDGVLSARQLASEFAGGRVTAEGTLDLRRRPCVGRVSLAASNVSVSRLPDGWAASEEVEGVFSGKAELQVAIGERDVAANGRGDGTIDQAAIFGLPTSPIQATLDLTRLSHDFSNASTAAEGTLRLGVEMDEVAVRDVWSRLKVTPESLAVSVDGKASVDASLEIPLASFSDTASYRGSAVVSFDELLLGGERLTNVQASAKYEDGRADVESFAGHFGTKGRISGNGSARLAPRGPITGQVALEQTSLKLLNKLLSKGVGDAEGDVSGEFTLTGSADRWKELDAWEVSGDVRTEKLAVFGHAVTDVVSQVSSKEGVVSFAEVKATWNGASVGGQATIDVQAPHSFVADFAISETRVSKMASSFDSVRPPAGLDAQVAFSGTFSGRLTPLSWSATGTGHLRDAKFDQFAVPETDFAWRMNPDEVAITAGDIAMYAGKIAVQANLPLDREEASRATVTLRGIDVALAAKQFGALPIELTGKADGELTLTDFHDAAKLAARANLKGASTRIQTVAVDQLAAELGIQTNVADYRLTGNVLGGQFEFSGKTSVDEVNVENLKVPGKLTLRDVRLSQLAEHLSQSTHSGLAPLSGLLTAELDVTSGGPKFQPEGQGWIKLHQLQWDRKELAADTTAVVLLSPSSLQIRDLGIQLGEGSIRGEWTSVFDAQHPGSFRLTATRINAKRLLAPWPDVARRVEGIVDARVVGEPGTNWVGTAQIAVTRAKVAGIPVGASRLPVDWAYSPATGQGRVRMRETVLQVAGGRVTARSTFDWGQTVNVSATARLAALNVKSLLQAAPHVTSVQSGRLNGRLQLKGRNVRSPNSLVGTFSGTLENAQTLQLPALRNISRFLGVGQIGAAKFDSSELELRLAKGFVHIDRMAIANSAIQLLIDGRLSLTGRLDLNVVAHAGQFDSQPELRRLVRASVLLAPPVPVALLVEANDFLSDRLVFLHIGGTLRSPSTRLRTAPLLQQEAMQFFLRKATNAAIR